MTQPPDVRTAPPPATSPPAGVPVPHASAPPPPFEPRQHQPVWIEGARRAREVAGTEPGRLLIIGAALAALIMAFGVTTAWQVHDRRSSASTVIEHSEPLARDAARIYRSLADANTTASTGFLAGGQESLAVRKRYEQDIQMASELLAKAAANSEGAEYAQYQITIMNRELPRYTGMVESARVNNRQGLPLGGAYLRYANDQMTAELLPAARKLYKTEIDAAYDDYHGAREWPLSALGLGVVTLGALVWAQRRHYHRTNRVLNPGLVGATVVTVITLGWLAGGHTMARSDFTDAHKEGAVSMSILTDAWTNVLRARGDENIWLVGRGSGKDYDAVYEKRMEAIAGERGERGGLLAQALAIADDRAGSEPVQEAIAGVNTWREKHRDARTKEESGDYQDAVSLVIESKDSSEEAFNKVDKKLREASVHEQGQFLGAARDGRDTLGGLPVGATVLAVLGALGALLGIGRRLSEYR
ncbi:hypothetical protein [Streptomyces sp. NPDC054784]